jgi:nitrite reductase/ring-hydroxylating ferredoxin subunit
MAREQRVVDRRHLLVLAGAAVMTHACAPGESPLGGPYGGSPGSAPGPDGGPTGEEPEAGSESGGGGTGSGSGGGSGGSAGGADGGASGGAEAGGRDGGAEGGGGLPACPTSGTVLTLTFAAYPRLKNVGDGVSVQATGYSDPNCKQDNIIVVQKSAGVFIALSQSCPHACCLVSFSGTGFNCPCHGASFDLSGACTNGRAPASLATLEVCADDDGVYVTLG